MLSVSLYNANQHRQIRLTAGVLYVGSGTADTWDEFAAGDSYLQVVDPRVPSQQLSLRCHCPGEVELQVFNDSIELGSGTMMHAGDRKVLALPVSFGLGDTHLQIVATNEQQELDAGLNTMTVRSGLAAEPSTNQAKSPGPATLAAWLETLGKLQRVVAGSDRLFQLAAQAVFNPGGLDGGFVLVPSSEGWTIAASHIPYPDHGIGYRDDLVQQARSSGSTVYHDADLINPQSSTRQRHAAVVCPIMDESDQCIGVVYGFRSLHRRNHRRGIRFLEAQFVQVVADALSAAMFRLEAESNAARSRVLLEQAFAPGIARQLHANQQVLEATNREVTVLFADLRGFSEISERIGTHETYELLSDVMDEFSAIITDHDGVIIDFFGDGVSAFWNAPLDQDQHAMLACQTGLEMIDVMPRLNRTWAKRIGAELKVGIGVHTGFARVGNSGSRTRLKYGPRGKTINLASRLEALTKQWDVPLLVSGETAAEVEGAFHTSLLATTTLRGFNSPTRVFRLTHKYESFEPSEFVERNGDEDFDDRDSTQRGESTDVAGQ